MSDGPYKSLPMPSWWKNVAEEAQNENYDEAQLQDAKEYALARDVKLLPKEIGKGIREVLERDNMLLPFSHNQGEEIGLLESLRKYAPGNQLANNLIDLAQKAVIEGRRGRSATIKVIEQALQIKLNSNARQIGEHYLRDSNDKYRKIAGIVREKIENDVGNTKVSKLAEKFANGESIKLTRPKKKRSGLDDGVPRK